MQEVEDSTARVGWLAKGAVWGEGSWETWILSSFTFFDFLDTINSYSLVMIICLLFD